MVQTDELFNFPLSTDSPIRMEPIFQLQVNPYRLNVRLRQFSKLVPLDTAIN